MATCLNKRKICIALLVMETILYVILNVLLRTLSGGDHPGIKDGVKSTLRWNLGTTISNSSISNDHVFPSETSSGRSLLIPNGTKHKGKKRLPDAIVIGARKCGTRALLEFLKIHPRVRACNTETHYFDDDTNYRLGTEWYRQKMPKSLPHHVTLEKTPAYFVTDEAPRRVYEMSKEVKLIVIVRDPTERAISDYLQINGKSHRRTASFERFITKDDARKELKTSISVVGTGVYIRHLKKWLNYFPLSQFHFVSGEELIKNPAKELQAVERFLNIEPFITEEFFYMNTTKRFPCLASNFDAKGRQDSGCLSKEKGRPHPVIRENIRQLLQDYYRPFNVEFYEVVRRNFNWS